MRISRNDVANLAGVSPTTVSFVLNNRTDMGISAETIVKVQQAAKKLGYIPNRAARVLKTGKSNVVALWISNITTPYYSDAVHNIQKSLSDNDYDMLIGDTKHVDIERRVRSLSEWFVDGVIAYDCRRYVESFLNIYGETNLPIVSIGSSYCNMVDYVTFDISYGVLEAFNYFINNGCKNIAYVVPEQGRNVDNKRLKIYNKILKANNIDSFLIPIKTNSRDEACQTIKNYDKIKLIDAIYCYNDDIAIGTLRGLNDMGIKVPDDILLIGTDNINEGLYTNPRLSSVVIPTKDMCETAWKFLRNRMQNRNLPIQSKVFKSSLYLSESSKIN